MSDITSRAREFAQAHESGNILVLPTVWDT